MTAAEAASPDGGGDLLTVGHGRIGAGELADLLTGAGITQLVDVRRFPGSRTNEAAARGAIEEICTGAGIGYRWDERLGGRRRTRRRRRPTPPTPGGGSRSSAPTPGGPAARSSAPVSPSCGTISRAGAPP